MRVLLSTITSVISVFTGDVSFHLVRVHLLDNRGEHNGLEGEHDIQDVHAVFSFANADTYLLNDGMSANENGLENKKKHTLRFLSCKDRFCCGETLLNESAGTKDVETENEHGFSNFDAPTFFLPKAA